MKKYPISIGEDIQNFHTMAQILRQEGKSEAEIRRAFYTFQYAVIRNEESKGKADANNPAGSRQVPG